MRTTARETAFKVIFSSQFTKDVDVHLLSALYKSENLNANDIEYCNKLIGTISDNKSSLLQLIDSHSTMFPEARLFPADRSILLIALCEILYFNDIPSAVSVNEAANIASKYSSEKSASFISGILAEIIKEHSSV